LLPAGSEWPEEEEEEQKWANFLTKMGPGGAHEIKYHINTNSLELAFYLLLIHHQNAGNKRAGFLGNGDEAGNEIQAAEAFPFIGR